MGPNCKTSYSNKLGRLCQGIRIDPTDPDKQQVKGTNTCHAICCDDTPMD